MPKQIVNISDTVKSFQEKVNIISADVGWRGNLTTAEDSDIVGAINEHDAELGTITAGAMGTTASTVSTAIAELDGRLDSANNTQINSAKLFMRDSAALNIIKGNLNLHGNMDIDGTLTVDGVVNFKAGTNGSVTLGDANTDNVVFSADVNSHIIPNTDNAYDLGTNAQQWRDVYINGTGYIDAVSADTLDVNTSATIATAKIEDLTDNRVVIVGTGGELEDDANFTFDGTTFTLNGNVDVGNGLDVTGNITVTGTVDGRDIATDGTLLDTLDGELGTISAAAMGTTASTVSGAILELETEIDTLNTKVEPSQALTTTATTLSDAINELDGELGTITTAVMGTTASDVGAAIGELEGEIDTLNTKVEPSRAFGSTFTATTVMAALNELKTQTDLLDSGSSVQIDQIGDLASLDTTAKNNLVAAINELDDRIDTDADFRDKVSAIDSGGDGSFRYVQATGKFIYKGPSATDVRAHFSGGTDIGISDSGAINHDAISSSTSAATAASPGYGGSFTYVNGITVSDQGHVTDVETKQITLPASDNTDTTYSAATSDALGLSKLGSNTAVTGTEQSVTTTAGRFYKVQHNSSDQLVVNVPWVDTNDDTNTTYSAGNDLNLTGTEFEIESELNHVTSIATANDTNFALTTTGTGGVVLTTAAQAGNNNGGVIIRSSSYNTGIYTDQELQLRAGPNNQKINAIKSSFNVYADDEIVMQPMERSGGSDNLTVMSLDSDMRFQASGKMLIRGLGRDTSGPTSISAWNTGDIELQAGDGKFTFIDTTENGNNTRGTNDIQFDLINNNSDPSDGETISKIHMKAKNSAGTMVDYARIFTAIKDETATSTAGRFQIDVRGTSANGLFSVLQAYGDGNTEVRSLGATGSVVLRTVSGQSVSFYSGTNLDLSTANNSTSLVIYNAAGTAVKTIYGTTG